MKTKAYQLNKAKFLSDAEITLLKSNLEGAPLRDRLLIELALATGGRAQEILNIRPMDLDHAEKSVQIYGLKASRDRAIPLPVRLFDTLVSFAAGVPDKSRIFTLSYRYFDIIWKKYAPLGKTIHSTRHTFALELYKKTKDIIMVKNALGHTNISNTMIYADFATGINDLRKVLLDE